MKRTAPSAVGEILPKALTQQRATAVALRTFRPLRAASWMLAPLVWTANAIVGAILGGLMLGLDMAVMIGALAFFFLRTAQDADLEEERRRRTPAAASG